MLNKNKLFKSVCTVVQNCCKGDEPCQWTRYLDPRVSKTPEPIDIKVDMGDLRRGHHLNANFGISIPKGGGCAYA